MAITLAIVVAAVGVALYGLHRLAQYAERRGWIYYRNTRRAPGVGLGLLAPIYNPALEHVVEEGTSVRARRDEIDRESGDTDDPDGDDHRRVAEPDPGH